VLTTTNHEASYTAPLDLTTGSATIRSSPKVRWAIYGHTHQVGRYQVGPITAYGTPLGYPRERRGIEAEALIQSRIGWIEL
jgi:hypothetical protein